MLQHKIEIYLSVNATKVEKNSCIDTRLNPKYHEHNIWICAKCFYFVQNG